MSTKTKWPTPTGEPAKEHEALKLAEALETYDMTFAPGGPYGCTETYYRTENGSCDLDNSAALIRRQHALIVQMREALWIAVEHNRLWHGDNHNTMLTGMPALTAANDYLKG